MLQDIGIRDYRIHTPQPPASEDVHYGVWVEFRKALQ
jgi:hypothetical protein